MPPCLFALQLWYLKRTFYTLKKEKKYKSAQNLQYNVPVKHLSKVFVFHSLLMPWHIWDVTAQILFCLFPSQAINSFSKHFGFYKPVQRKLMDFLTG